MVLEIVMGDGDNAMNRNKDLSIIYSCACKIDWENLNFEVAASQNYLTSSTPADQKFKYCDFRYVLLVQDKSLMSKAVSVVQRWVSCITYCMVRTRCVLEIACLDHWNLGRSRPY
jgi:hypothetical protein